MNDDHDDSSNPKDFDFSQLDREVNKIMGPEAGQPPQPPRAEPSGESAPATKPQAPRGFALDVMHPQQRMMRSKPSAVEPELPVGNEHLLAEEDVAQEESQTTAQESQEVAQQIKTLDSLPEEKPEQLAGWHVPPLNESEPNVAKPEDLTPPKTLEQESQAPAVETTPTDSIEALPGPTTEKVPPSVDNEIPGALPANNLVQDAPAPLPTAIDNQNKPTMFDTKQYHTPIKDSPKKSSDTPWIVALIVLLLVIIAGALWYYFMIFKH